MINEKNETQENLNVGTSVEAGVTENVVVEEGVKRVSGKKIGIILTSSLAILLFGLGVFWALVGKNYVKTEEQVQDLSESEESFVFGARAVYVDGMVWRKEGDRLVSVKEGDGFIEGDELSTGKGARLVLETDEGSILRLDEESEIVLSELTAERMVFFERSGSLFAKVRKDENHRFIIQAGEITVESLGTSFLVENDDEVKVQVFESQVKVLKDGEEDKVGEQEEWKEKTGEVKKIDQEEMKKDEFVNWSLEDKTVAMISKTPSPEVTKKVEPTEAKEPTNTPEPGASIKLSGETDGSGVVLEWVANGLDVSNGFKAVKSLTANPVFPGDSYVYLDANKNSHRWGLTDGKEWHFRVCQYLGEGKCGSYSNEIVLTAPTGGTSNEGGDTGNGTVNSISLSGSKVTEGEVKMTWTVDGSSPKRFKVTWGETSGPTYPPRSGEEKQWHYISKPEQRNDSVSGLIPGKTYYFRVCEYLGGTCGKYSNELSIGI